MRADVIDQALNMALHPALDCFVSIASASMILCLTQSPKAHTYIIRKEVMEKMLEMCELKHKMINEQLSQSHQGRKESLMAVNALKYVITIVFLLSTHGHVAHTSLFWSACIWALTWDINCIH